MNRLFERKEDCYGCGSCRSICPQNAIELRVDEQGFKYPEINRDICIDCGLCEKACQIGKENNLKNQKARTCIAVKLANEIRRKSSSGGIYTALSNAVLSAGGMYWSNI